MGGRGMRSPRRWMIIGIVLVVGLFLFVQFQLPALLEGAINKTRAHAPYEIRPDAAALHEKLFVADLHSDALLWKRDLTQRSSRGHVDLPRLRQGNVALQVFTATTKTPSSQNYRSNSGDSDIITYLALAQLWPPATWSSLAARAHYQLDELHDLERRSEGRFRVIRNQADMKSLVADRARGGTTVGGIFGIEGAHALDGELDEVDRLYAAGMRVIGLSHFFDNELGGSLHGTSGAGLSAFGRKVVTRADALGLIIDVAHASPQIVRDVLAMTSRPVILSHGGIRSVCDVGRNLDDDLMRAIAQHGGIAGIGFWDAAVCDITPPGIVRALRRAVEVMGIDHVALGSDYDGATEVLLDSSELAILTQTMLDQGFGESEIAKIMGGNVRDFFLQQLPAE